MGQVQSIEKASKALKNSYSKGVALESELSKVIHRRCIPVLVSSRLLRSIGCGQIDICGHYGNSLIIYEVKHKPEAMTQQQRARLNQSLEFLCHVFDSEVHIEVLKNLPKD